MAHLRIIIQNYINMHINSIVLLIYYLKKCLQNPLILGWDHFSRFFLSANNVKNCILLKFILQSYKYVLLSSCVFFAAVYYAMRAKIHWTKVRRSTYNGPIVKIAVWANTTMNYIPHVPLKL